MYVFIHCINITRGVQGLLATLLVQQDSLLERFLERERERQREREREGENKSERSSHHAVNICHTQDKSATHFPSCAPSHTKGCMRVSD